jgi:type I restriction enzyme S subunit
MSKHLNVPDGWHLTQLGDIGHYINGYPFKPTDWQDVGMPIIRIQNLTDNNKPFNKYCGTIDDRYRIHKGDIVISWSATLGVYKWNGPDAWLNQHIFKAVVREDVIDKSFFYFVASRAVDHMSQAAHGSTMQHVTSSAFTETPLLQPPFPEQRKIADILGSVDENIEATHALIDKLQDLKKATMQELLTKGIGHTQFKDSPAGRIPEEWKVVKLGEIADFKNGINFSNDQKGQGILTIDVLNMYGDSCYIDVASLYRVDTKIANDSILFPGDILFVRSSMKEEGVGRCALFGGYSESVTFCGFVIRARLSQSSVMPEYATYYMRSPVVRRIIQSCSGRVAITNISQDILAALPIALPSLAEQVQISQIISELDNNIKKRTGYLSKIQNLKKALMQDLLTGKVRIKV